MWTYIYIYIYIYSYLQLNAISTYLSLLILFAVKVYIPRFFYCSNWKWIYSKKFWKRQQETYTRKVRLIHYIFFSTVYIYIYIYNKNKVARFLVWFIAYSSVSYRIKLHSSVQHQCIYIYITMSYNMLWWHILKYYRAAVFAAVFLLWYVLVINFDIYNFSITVSRFEFCLLYFLSTRFTLNNAGNGEKKAFCFLVVLFPCMHCFDV